MAHPAHWAVPRQSQLKACSPLSPEPWRIEWTPTSLKDRRDRPGWCQKSSQGEGALRVLYQSSKAVQCPLNAPIVPLWEDRPGRAGSGNWPYNRGTHKGKPVQTEAWKHRANVCCTNTHTTPQTSGRMCHPCPEVSCDYLVLWDFFFFKFPFPFFVMSCFYYD